MAARKYWLRNVPVDAGVIVIDEGAAGAVRERGASLLPGGVTAAEGDFRRGDMITVRVADGPSIARGVTQYPASDVRRLLRRHSRDIEGILGYSYGENIIHRDDLIVI